jgi:hypothetical protein
MIGISASERSSFGGDLGGLDGGGWAVGRRGLDGEERIEFGWTRLVSERSTSRVSRIRRFKKPRQLGVFGSSSSACRNSFVSKFVIGWVVVVGRARCSGGITVAEAGFNYIVHQREYR